MTKVTKYKAKDGREFSSEADCQAHEALLARVEAVMANTPKVNKAGEASCTFSNGGGYLQWTKGQYASALRGLKAIAEDCKLTQTYAWGSYGFMRTLDDGGHLLYGPVGRVLFCVDPVTLKEYGQPYYMTHQREVKDVCFNQ